MTRNRTSLVLKSCVAAIMMIGATAQAADWSDTSISLRHGSKFTEPFNPDDISKNIIALTHVSGYKYGTNFLNVDMLLSDSKDPSNFASTNGAHEVYVLYRNTIDLGKVTGSDIKFGPVRGMGVTLGFDMNTKTDVGYNSKKRMLVVGPTFMMDVPGFLNVSLLALSESNQPSGTTFFTTPPSNYSVSRYSYDTHAMLTAAWGIPLGSLPLSFEGFVNFIAKKGKDEFGAETAAETNFDGQIMYDIVPKTFRIGIEYQYWKNKFGNPGSVPGSTAKTPMIRVEYHF